MPCWPAYSNLRSSTSLKSNSNQRNSPPANLSSPTSKMKTSSSVHRPSRHVASSSHYDTPPWRVDQPNGALVNPSSPSAVTNGNKGIRDIGATQNPAFYEPDVTSWKIGPPLLSPDQHTTNRFSPLTTHRDTCEQGKSANGYSQTNGISSIPRRFENGNPFLDKHPLNSPPQTNGFSNDNVSHTFGFDDWAQINRPYQTSTMNNNASRDPHPRAQTTDRANQPVFTYRAPNGTAWVSNTPLHNQNGPMSLNPVRTNGSISPIPTDQSRHEMNTRSDAPTLGNQNGSTLSPFEAVKYSRSVSPIPSNQNGVTVIPVEPMRTIRSGSPVPINHNGRMSPTFGTDTTNGLHSPTQIRRETTQKTSKTAPSEWAYRPANPPQHERFRTIPMDIKSYDTGPRKEAFGEENPRPYMTIQKTSDFGSGPNKLATTTERANWNSNPAQTGRAGRTEKIVVTEDEYRFGREIKLSTSRFASNMNLPSDYFDKIFEDAGMPGMSDLDVFGITYPSPKSFPFPGDDRRNTTGSSGYDSLSFSPLLPSPFSPHQPAHLNPYQPQSPYDPTVDKPSTPMSLDPHQPSQPATAPIKGRSSKKDKESTGPGIGALKESCSKAGQLYRDIEFPAESKSLYFSMAPVVHGTIEWKRPFEICNGPQFVVNERDRFDVVQGQIGNCWLVAAIAGLTLNKKLLERVCPVNQSFDKTYAGVFHFRFWRFGKWVEVVIDDRLPTVDGRLIYLRSSKPNEFWSALTEKAYAKIIGTYEALDGGVTSEGVTDFTGGIVESLNLREGKNPWGILLKAFQKGSIMGCGIDPTPGIREQELANGLVCGHAYTITCVKQLPGQRQPLQLVRLRNPWGSEHEWKGAWSDRSSEWQRVPQSVQTEMGLIARADGEFWMSFDDFRYNFHTVDLCHLPPDATEGGDQWQVTQKHGAWVPGVSSGGCGNYQDTFHINPQYRVRLSEPDDGHQDGLCTMIVSMTQKNRRKRASEGAKNLSIGYSIVKAPVGTTGPLDQTTLRRCETVGSIPSFINSRDVSHRHELPPGEYVIIPSTFTPHVQGEFLLRIYTEKAADHQELDEETDLSNMNTLDSIPLTPVEKKREEDAMNSFDLVAGDDGEIDAWELKKIITLMFTKDFPQFDGFGVEAARSMIAMHDGDMSGKLGREEFVTLYKELNRWKKAFKEHDVDEGGTMDIHELRSAFKSFGFTLSNRLLVAIGRRYANKAGVIDIQDFILCACRVKTIIETFQANKTKGGSTATFPMDEFMTSMLYS